MSTEIRGGPAVARDGWDIYQFEAIYRSQDSIGGIVFYGRHERPLGVWDIDNKRQDELSFDTVLAAQEWVETMCSEAESLREMQDTMEQFTRLWGLV